MYTARQLYEATLIELSKVQAPPLKLYEFNYFANKVINQFVNKVYNMYDINLQTTDDLRVLKSTATLNPIANTNNRNTYTYEVYLPLDYLHMLNCVLVYEVTKQHKCYDAGDIIQIPAKRLTADSWSTIMTDIYNRPTPMNPYYYLHNVNTQTILPTNPYAEKDVYTGLNLTGTDPVDPFLTTKNVDLVNNVSGVFIDGEYTELSRGANTESGGGTTEIKIDLNKIIKQTPNTLVTVSGEKGTLYSGDFDVQNNVIVQQSKELTRENIEGSRLGNSSNIRCEIRYGKDSSIFSLLEVQIDYLKVPQHIRLTQNQLDMTEDFSQILEFPDYVNQEITNELVLTLMVHFNDPRTANTVLINQSIARQQLEQTRK